MKYLFVAFLGFLLGSAAALAVLYYNPLTAAPPARRPIGELALHYALPAQSLEFVAGERALLPGAPARDEEFWEDTIDRTALLALSLNDALGTPKASATRLLQVSSDTDLLLRGVLVSDHWLLTIPGEGSLFVRVDTNLWPFLKQAFIPTWYLGRPWQGPFDYRPTVGPGPESAVILGATGRFANVEGSAVEQYRLTSLDRRRGAVALDGELRLNILETAVVAESPR